MAIGELGEIASSNDGEKWIIEYNAGTKLLNVAWTGESYLVSAGKGKFLMADARNKPDLTINKDKKLEVFEGVKHKLILEINRPNALVNGSKSMIDKTNQQIFPLIKNGRTLIPLRFISESLGEYVTWDDNTKTANVTDKSKIIKITMGSNKMLVNDSAVDLDVPAEIINGRVYLPLRKFVEEGLNMNIYYNDGIIVINNEPISMLSDEQNTSIKVFLQDKEIDGALKDSKKIKGLYLTGTSAGTRLEFYKNLANRTQINSFVIDYKDDDGVVYVDSKIPLTIEIKAIDTRYKTEEVIQKLHANNIYAIARIVCFKDPILAKKKPELSIKNNSGKPYIFNMVNWVDVYNKEVWKYNIDLAKEALEKGFDEVQFDYLKIPTGKKDEMVFPLNNGKSYYQNFNDFLAYARKELPKKVLSVNVFENDIEDIGDTSQIVDYLELMGKEINYINLMVYPSQYPLGTKINDVQFPKPDLMPYQIVNNALERVKERLAKTESNKMGVRVWLQDFTASWLGKGNFQPYGEQQIKQQIMAVNSAEYEEWLLWDHMNTYEEVALFK